MVDPTHWIDPQPALPLTTAVSLLQSVACSDAGSLPVSLVRGSGLAPLACGHQQCQLFGWIFGWWQWINSLACSLRWHHLLGQLFVDGSHLAPLACSLWQRRLLGPIFGGQHRHAPLVCCLWLCQILVRRFEVQPAAVLAPCPALCLVAAATPLQRPARRGASSLTVSSVGSLVSGSSYAPSASGL